MKPHRFMKPCKLRKVVCLAFLALAVCATGLSQTADYSIYSSKKELLGQLRVSKIDTDSTTKIAVISQFEVKMLMTIQIKYTLQTLYYNSKLASSYVKTYKNDELNSFSKTIKVGAQYEFVKDNIESYYSEQITFSESLLYFNEPDQVSALYSEFDGVKKMIIHRNAGHYKIQNPLNGNISEYFYEDGTLKTAIVQFQMMTLYLTKDL